MHVVGTIRSTRSGFAFLIRDDGEDDVLVSADGLQGAIHGDRVRVLLFPRAHDFRPVATVEEILGRPNPHFTGELIREGRAFWVRPDSPMLPERMSVRLGEVSPVAGAKVLFRVENSHRRQNTPYAVLEETLGDADDARLDPLVIASEFGLPTRFSDAAESEAEVVTRGEPWCREAEEEDAKREDFRGQTIVTIDPVDAKDFDDAIALEPLADGHRLFVHIADVTYYVREGTTLDQEARERGTSTYFPGTVLPMLPEAISSVAASLSPEADKRTMTAVLDLGPEGELRSTRIARGWMRSSARLHYDQVQAFLDGREEIAGEVGDLLRVMQELARVLRRRRFEGGGFELEVPEAVFRLGADGVPTKILRRTQAESHQIIEEFMIAANRAVGAWAKARAVPFLFRVHDEPDEKALDEFLGTALTLKPGTRMSEVRDIPALRRWLAGLPSGEPLSRVLHRFFLRTMKKAVYSAEDIGHFGLGIEAYAHFTSPIRRYPDLFDHRRLKELLDGVRPSPSAQDAPTLADQTSRTEQNSEAAEREMNLLKTIRFLQRKEGQTARGHVTALTPRGLFIELEKIPAEGFVPRDSLPLGTEFAEERLAFIEKRSKWELRPGDPVIVQIVFADLRKRRIEFRIVETVRGPRSGSEGSRVSGTEEGTRGRGRSGRGRARKAVVHPRARARSAGAGGRSGRSPEGRTPSGAGDRPVRGGRSRPGKGTGTGTGAGSGSGRRSGKRKGKGGGRPRGR